VTALPDISGVPHPPTWQLHPRRWFGRFVVRRRVEVREHGVANVPVDGPVIVLANNAELDDRPLVALFGPRPVLAVGPDDGSAAPGVMRTCLRVLADGHVLGLYPEHQRGAAYLALVSGAPVVPLTFLDAHQPRRGRLDLVYGTPYRTAALAWPRTKKQVEATALDLRVHMLVALDAARSLTGRQLPGPVPPAGGTS
jgi:1-acyl-sn-glycerol-3-phosphate acyltransferase